MTDIKQRWAESLRADIASSQGEKSEIDVDAAKNSVDELLTLTSQYRSSRAYHELLKFMVRFRWYSPFNAMLVNVQLPGATFVASPSRWLNRYKRRVKVGAQPLMILQPRGPVMFVFDVSDTEPEEGARPLPAEVLSPFGERGRRPGAASERLDRLIQNAVRDGVRVGRRPHGSQGAGSLRWAKGNATQTFTWGVQKPQSIQVPVLFDVLIDSKLAEQAQFSTMVHELAHLYCGHIGTPDKKLWPNRSSLSVNAKEVEAESIAYIVCGRAGIPCKSEEYLAGYSKKEEDTTSISLERVTVVSRLIEEMSQKGMRPRPPRNDTAGA